MSLSISLDDMIGIKPFDAIPSHQQSARLARIYIGTGRCGLKNIPAHFIDDELRLLAVSVGGRTLLGGIAMGSFMTIEPSHTDRYEEIALVAIKNDSTNARHVDSTVMNNSFMKKALAVNGDALIPFLRDQKHMGKITVTQELIDLAVSNSPSYFSGRLFLDDQYRAPAVSQCIKNHGFNPKELVNIGHFSTLVDVIKSGSWPAHFPDQPIDLKDGISKMMLLPEDNRILYRAYVMSYPISDVIDAMVVDRYKDELLNMYSPEELAQFLREGSLAGDRGFKGRLLERGLGL